MKRILKRRLSLLLAILMLLSCFAGNISEVKADTQTATHLVIQEIYGGGGNSGATYKNDYVMLYNPTKETVNIDGWSVQYAAKAGVFGSGNLTKLNGNIEAGKYFLVGETPGTGGTVDLPTVDASGSIAMGGSDGKVALVKSATAISGKADLNVIDFVGYGAANEYEGTASIKGANGLLAVSRAADGIDTDNNAIDFKTASPSPKNSAYINPAPIDTKVANVIATPQAGTVKSGQELTLSCSTTDSSIYYQINGGSINTYNQNSKPVLDSLPATVVTWGEKTGLNNGDKNTYQYTQSVTPQVSAAPVSGNATVGDVIKLSAVTDAVIKYSVDEGKTWLDYGNGITVTKLPFSVQAKATALGYAESQASTFNYISAETPAHTGDYKIYFGQLHSHTTLSDGAGTVEQAFDYASKAGNLDFLAVTDHSNSFEDTAYTASLGTDAMNNAKWKEGKTAATSITSQGIKNTDNTADTNSTFLGIYGFEMTWSDGSGHINTFNTPGFENRNNPIFANKVQTSANPSGLDTYYNKLAQVSGSLSQFNHPGTTFGDFYDFTDYSAQNDNSMKLIEVGNGEGAIGSNGYFPSYGYYTRALDKGWHLAPSNNQDNHKGKWGDSNTARTVILADNLTENSLYDAISNYRVYATEDNDLQIQYNLNGSVMGTTLSENPKTINIDAKISDPTDKSIGKVEVIVNGGKVADSKTVDGNSSDVTFSMNNDYTYYYLRITQPDGDVAVTAPVWTGDVEKAGIASVQSDTVLPINGETINLTTNLYNNDGSNMEIESIEYNDGSIFKTINGSDLTGGAILNSLATKSFSFVYSPNKNGDVAINVTMKAKLNGSEKLYTSVLKLNVSDPKTVTKVLIDGTHSNDYVNGYYAGNMTNFINICANDGIQARIETSNITKEMLDSTDLLVVTAPLKSDKTGVLTPTSFSDDFNKLVSDYVNNGGTAIVCGLADYQDSSLGDPYTTTTQVNDLLKTIGAKTTLNSDEAYDTVTNAGQAYRLKLKNINLNSSWTSGVDAAQEYSVYSGCTVNPASETDWLVKGFSTTYSINSKKLTNSKYESNVAVNATVMESGNACVLATEKVGKGKIFVGGTVFMSNFEVQATLDSYSDLQYSNYTIINNILDSVKNKLTVSTIADVRKNGIAGDVYEVEGTVTAGSEGGNAFFDTIYIQDSTGGINVFPIANGSGIKIGQKVRIIGHVDSYQGDKELKIGSGIEGYTVIDSNVNEVSPTLLTTTQSMDYDSKGGSLVKVQGTVSDVAVVNGTVSSFNINDGSGKNARIFIDGYVAKSFDYAKIIANGYNVSVVGLVYDNPDGVCIRVRNCNEITLISNNPKAEYITNDSEGIHAFISGNIEMKDADGNIIDKSKAILKVDHTGSDYEFAKDKMKQAMLNENINVNGNQSILFYEVSLLVNDNKVSFYGGKIRLVFAYPPNTSKNGFQFKVLHLKDNGTIETIVPILEDTSFYIEVDSLSPFAIIYTNATVNNSGGSAVSNPDTPSNDVKTDSPTNVQTDSPTNVQTDSLNNVQNDQNQNLSNISENISISTGRSPNTGDSSMIALYFEGLSVSLLLATILSRRKRKTCDK